MHHAWRSIGRDSSLTSTKRGVDRSISMAGGYGSGGGDIAVHVELLARRLMRKQAGAAAEEQHRAMATTHRLSRVPLHLRDNNNEAYTPGFVAVGPLHSREDRRLRPAERLKVAYLNGLISRGYPDPAQHLAVIQEYVGIVAAREPEARALYAAEDVANITPDDFIQMMVLDGCFIIEHLVNVAIGREDPSLHATPFALTQLSVDLILAENQIPFFVLVDLISSTKLPEFETTGYAPPVLLVKLVLYYLAGEKGRDMSESLPAAENVCHILHLLHEMITTARTSWEPPPGFSDGAVLETAQGAGRLLRRLPLLILVPLLYPILPEDRKWRGSYGETDVASASDLKRMSVDIKKARGVPVTGIASVMGPVPLAVKLAHEDRLQLPQLRLEFRTAPLLLNLMAFEQSTTTTTAAPSGPSQQDVSAYVSFMAKMVQSAEDAGVLAAADVVQQHGGAGNESKEEVARFFRAVGAAASDGADDGAMGRSYLGPMLGKLKERSRHPLFVMWADVQRNYFTLPWAVVAEFVALFTFISTIIQTYSSLSKKN